jgi:hypothetical protein
VKDPGTSFAVATTRCPRNYFDERIATSYRDKWPELFEPAVVDPAVRFLAELAWPGWPA